MLIEFNMMLAVSLCQKKKPYTLAVYIKGFMDKITWC